MKKLLRIIVSHLIAYQTNNQLVLLMKSNIAKSLSFQSLSNYNDLREHVDLNLQQHLYTGINKKIECFSLIPFIENSKLQHIEMKFEIIFLGLLALMTRADYIYDYSKPLQMVPTTAYATTSSYYLPGQTMISSFTKTAPLLQNAQTNLQSSVAATLIQPQGYIQPVNTMAISATRYSLTPGANTFMASSGSSYKLTPTYVSTPASAPVTTQRSNFVPISAPVPNLISTPTLAPTLAPVPVANQLSTPTYSSSLSQAGSLQMAPTTLTQPLTQSVPKTTAYSRSLPSQVPTYSTFNSISGVNNAISGINNSGSGDNNLISGENNCLTGDRNYLIGGSNLVSGDSNTILGDQNYVTGSSNTVMALPSTLPTSSNLSMGPDVIASGTLPPSPTSLLI